MNFFKKYQEKAIFFCALYLCTLVFCSISFSNEQTEETKIAKLSSEELETLVAPIALYPDDLLAQVLTASTVPLDVVKAARYQQQNKGATKPPEEAMESWEPSVVSLMMFPETLKMLNDNIDWTEQLGVALFSQEEDVYDSIQQLRRQADAAGNLENNDKQVITKDKEIIKIVPADPEIIYVPIYDPQTIYVPTSTVVVSGPPPPVITFGVGIAVGIGLSYAFDWHHHHVVHHPHWGRPGHHHSHYYKRLPPPYPGRPPGAWRPPPPRPGYHPRPPRPAPRPPGYRPPPPGSRPPGYRPPPGGRPPGYKPPPPGQRPPGALTRPAPSQGPKGRPAGIAPPKPQRAPAAGGYNRGSETRKASSRGRQSQMSGGSRSHQAKPQGRPAGSRRPKPRR